ncbi:hypothetical protein FB451DRAFT_1188160 [Mycena latifolia]|nr:hypothetical protein FB451DRAFT_1188160 [Mycena latifolia]
MASHRFDYAGLPHSEGLVVAPKVLTGTEWENFPRDCDAPVNSSRVCAYAWFWGLTTQNGSRNHWASASIMPTFAKKRGAPGFYKRAPRGSRALNIGGCGFVCASMIFWSSGLIFFDIVDDIHFLSLALPVARDVEPHPRGNVEVFFLPVIYSINPGEDIRLQYLHRANISQRPRQLCRSVRRAPWAADQPSTGRRRQAEAGRQPSVANPHSQVLPEVEIPFDDDLRSAGMIPVNLIYSTCRG